jgi:hypothetical protein
VNFQMLVPPHADATAEESNSAKQIVGWARCS